MLSLLLALVPLAGAHSFVGESWHSANHQRRQSCPDISPPAGFSAIESSFPPAGQIATLVSGDTVASDVYNQILAVPDYKTVFSWTPVGTSLGDFSNVSYPADDPHCWWSYTTCHSPKQSYLAEDTWFCPEPETWGLTFDDGPYCDHTQFYDFLSQRSLKATLFYIGVNVLQNPTQAQRSVVDGHEVCVHTWSHHYTTTLSNEQIFAELYYTKKIIKDVIGVTPTCWRPPFGDVDDRVRTWALALGLRTVIWNHDTDDWEENNGISEQQVEENYEQVYNNASAEGGVIVLTHELNPMTMDMFMSQYPTLIQHYQHVVPVASCMNITHPYLETNITYPNFAQFIAGNVNATTTTPLVTNVNPSISSEDPASTAPASMSSSSGGSSPTSGGSSPGSSSTPASHASSAGHVAVASGALGVVAVLAALL